MVRAFKYLTFFLNICQTNKCNPQSKNKSTIKMYFPFCISDLQSPCARAQPNSEYFIKNIAIEKGKSRTEFLEREQKNQRRWAPKGKL